VVGLFIYQDQGWQGMEVVHAGTTKLGSIS